MKSDIWKQYLEEEEKTKLVPQLAPYDWYKIKSPISFDCHVYTTFLEEQTRELSNTINTFRRYIKVLTVWQHIINDLDEKEQYNIVTEHISPIATLALNKPYIIRSRFIYSIAHLSHQANKFNQEEWKDDLPNDKEIYFETADRYGKPWKKYKKFKISLENIGNKKYGEDTHDFRNKYNHRYSPHIEVGLSGLVTRHIGEENDDYSVSYLFGQTEPLLLKDIIPLLTNELTLCLTAYKKYQDLINEQLNELNLINSKGVKNANNNPTKNRD